MKTIGMIGGMSWESTVTYYQTANTVIKEQLGGLHSAKVLLCSVDFHEIERCQSDGDWEKSAAIFTQAAKSLERGGADFIVICTNTMHRVAPQVQENINIPILHIAQATARRLKQRNIKRAALLGTIYTMEQDFYKDILIQEGIEVLTPQGKDAQLVNRVIYSELCLGVVSERSKREYLRIIGSLAQKGAQGVILGCTEIGLLIRQEDTPLPVFDTARIHAEQAALHAAGKA